MSKTGCLGGTSPSGRLGRNVAHGSFSSRAQRLFLWKKQSSQVGGFGLRGIGAAILAPSRRLCERQFRKSLPL